MVRLLAFLLAVDLADGQSARPEAQTEPLKADDIMAGVAANQDRSGALRKEYVYKQHIHIATQSVSVPAASLAKSRKQPGF